jgi:hypothetical protein
MSVTMGTSGTNVLSALLISPVMPTADVAAFAEAILDDINPTHPISPGAFSQVGLLYVPNRGVLKCLPGDYLAIVPATGWPILISGRAAGSNPQWVHT